MKTPLQSSAIFTFLWSCFDSIWLDTPFFECNAPFHKCIST